MDNEGNVPLVTVLGVTIIIAGIFVAYFTVTGASDLYGIGLVIAIILIASGFYIIRKSSKS